MMKMKFSKNAGILRGFLPLLVVVFVFLFSGVNASAQSLSPYSSDSMFKQYGDNFVTKEQASKLSKEAYVLTLALNAADPVAEANKSLDMLYAVTFADALHYGNSTVLDALNKSYDAIVKKSKDFVVTTDTKAIHAKYYDLMTQ